MVVTRKAWPAATGRQEAQDSARPTPPHHVVSRFGSGAGVLLGPSPKQNTLLPKCPQNILCRARERVEPVKRTLRCLIPVKFTCTWSKWWERCDIHCCVALSQLCLSSRLLAPTTHCPLAPHVSPCQPLPAVQRSLLPHPCPSYAATTTVHYPWSPPTVPALSTIPTTPTFLCLVSIYHSPPPALCPSPIVCHSQSPAHSPSHLPLSLASSTIYFTFSAALSHCPAPTIQHTPPVAHHPLSIITVLSTSPSTAHSSLPRACCPPTVHFPQLTGPCPPPLLTTVTIC